VNLAVVYRFGIRGVAVVYALTELLLLFGYSWVAWRKDNHQTQNNIRNIDIPDIMD
jgi:hypothetical protein